MIPQNFVQGNLPRHRQLQYTDGTPSREVEDDEEEDNEEMEKFKKGFAHKKKPSVLDVRDALCNLAELVDVAAAALMAPSPYTDPLKVYNIMQLHVIPKIKELEEELARL